MSDLTVDVKDAGGKKTGTATLPEAIFGQEVNVPLIHQVVVAQLAAARQGTHKVKGRGEVSGGGKKPWRQKGTGRARQGSTRAPQWTGGGTVHGPQPRSYAQRTPKKMIKAALVGALTDRARNARIHVVEDLVPGQKPSTKSARTFLERLTDRKSVLLVIGRDDNNSRLSARNLPGVHIIEPGQLNTYDVLNADDVVFSVEALHTFINRDAAQATATAAEEEK